MTEKLFEERVMPALKSLDQIQDLLESDKMDEMPEDLIVDITKLINHLNETIQTLTKQ